MSANKIDENGVEYSSSPKEYSGVETAQATFLKMTKASKSSDKTKIIEKKSKEIKLDSDQVSNFMSCQN